MPDKPNENKFLAMLERKGIVRKADDADEAADFAEENPRTYPETRPNITPAARQPIPGMINPGSSPQRTEGELRSHNPQTGRVVPLSGQGVNLGSDDIAMPRETMEVSFGSPEPVDVAETFKEVQPEMSPVITASVPTPTIDLTSSQDDFSPMSSSAQVPSPFPETQVAPSPERYTDRYMDVEELYEALQLNSKRTDTIYLIEEYVKTLPDSLPEDSRREIVGKIVAASGFDYDLLMGDGVLRVKMLKEYAEQFARCTEDYISSRNSELEQLEQQMRQVRKRMQDRRELHKRQFFTIEAEANRLKEILTFISG